MDKIGMKKGVELTVCRWLAAGGYGLLLGGDGMRRHLVRRTN
jgi:hypothetical protein